MFEEICLVCGKHLVNDGQAYCSDDCQSRDITSPSISSSSSALSSPHLTYANGCEVPPLMPSALGSALKTLRRPRPSSASWLSTPEDEDDFAIRTEFTETVDIAQDAKSLPLTFPYPLKSSALCYARRPSGTNNHSTVPQIDLRPPSVSTSNHVRGSPRSAPHASRSSTEDDDGYSDFGSSSRENLDLDECDAPSDEAILKRDAHMVKRSRNRASLPAYFSLLQISSSVNDPRFSPVSSSSGRTVARPSPPTPKMTQPSKLPRALEGNSHSNLAVHATPRGRRRIPGESSSNNRSDSSPSRSRSRTRRRRVEPAAAAVADTAIETVPRHRPNHEGRPDWASMSEVVNRGRAAFRRNSSPPPKVLFGMEDRGRTLAAVRRAEIFDNRSHSGSRTQERPRGRVRTEELDDFGFSEEAPGYGNGRSGLVGRERDRERERSLGFVPRIPL